MEQILKGDALELNTLLPKLDYSSTWGSPESFARHIASIDKDKAWNNAAWERGSSFSGTENMAQALELAKNGWTEGADKVERMRSGILAAHPVLVKAVRYDIAGSVANVPRAISGNPLNMKANDLSKSRRRPVLTLISSMSANCHIDKDCITNHAAVVAAIIDQIETMGYAVEVIAVAPTKGWGKDRGLFCTSVMVKASNQGLDIPRLAYGLGHASMFRRLVFADWCGDNRIENSLGAGLGSSLVLNHDDRDASLGLYTLPSSGEVPELFKKEEVAATKGLDFLIATLVKQGCPAFAGLPALPLAA
jgi:hypothetical protein